MSRCDPFARDSAEPILQPTFPWGRGYPRHRPAQWRLAAGLALGLMGLGSAMSPTPVGAVSLPALPYQPVLTLVAEGLQIYQSAELTPGVFAWQFVGPQATLFTDVAHTAPVGVHFNVATAPPGTMTTCPVAGFACPSWQAAADGSAVTAGRPLETTPSPHPDSIPELLLPAVSHVGDGLFSDIRLIQRLNTEGGLATACALPTGLGQRCDAAYTATYTFFATVPEPDVGLLLGTGLVGLVGWTWRWAGGSFRQPSRPRRRDR